MKPSDTIRMDVRAYGFLDFGAAKAEEVTGEVREALFRYLSEGRHGNMDYMARNVEKRLDPAMLVPGAESVLCFLAPYGQAGGGVAGFAQGQDYHRVIKDRLFAVIGELKEVFPGFEGRPFTDSAPVLERYWAVRAGLGFIGQNNCFISPEFGLRVLIGVIVCNIPIGRFEGHAPLRVSDCGACGRCLEACPTGALQAPFTLDARKCISYNNIESHTPPQESLDERKGWRFGCEECLRCCPWDKPLTPLPELETHRRIIADLSGSGWSKLSEEEFKRRFADSGLLRAGLDHLSAGE